MDDGWKRENIDILRLSEMIVPTPVKRLHVVEKMLFHNIATQD